MDNPQAPLFVIYRKRLGRPQWFVGWSRSRRMLSGKALWTSLQDRAWAVPREDADRICADHGGTVLPSTEKETK